MNTVRDISDYIIVRLDAAGEHLNFLKLHKLLYYCQAWNLAFGRGRLFDGNFQAWVHGPVNRRIYDAYSNKGLYSPVTLADVRGAFDPNNIPEEDRTVIDSVLDAYAGLTGDQLEEMTHREEPWVNARGGISPSARSETVISDDVMRAFYGARIQT